MITLKRNDIVGELLQMGVSGPVLVYAGDRQLAALLVHEREHRVIQDAYQGKITREQAVVRLSQLKQGIPMEADEIYEHLMSLTEADFNRR